MHASLKNYWQLRRIFTTKVCSGYKCKITSAFEFDTKQEWWIKCIQKCSNCHKIHWFENCLIPKALPIRSDSQRKRLFLMSVLCPFTAQPAWAWISLEGRVSDFRFTTLPQNYHPSPVQGARPKANVLAFAPNSRKVSTFCGTVALQDITPHQQFLCIRFVPPLSVGFRQA